MPCCCGAVAAEAGDVAVAVVDALAEATGMKDFLTAGPAFLACGRLMLCGLWKAVFSYKS
jgi:hypothetical protein